MSEKNVFVKDICTKNKITEKEKKKPTLLPKMFAAVAANPSEGLIEMGWGKRKR